MFERVTNPASKPPFVVDRGSLDRDSGRQIDWDALVDDRYDHGAAAVVLTESVDFGETALTVEDLTKPLRVGQLLDFGNSEGGTVTASAAIATATTVGVTALPRAMRSGEILDFGVSKEVQLTANAAKGATSITVAALDTALAGGEIATVPVVRQVLRVATAADVGDDSITVDAADMPIESGDVAYYGGTIGSTGRGRFIPAGTVLAELASGKVIPRAVVTGAETAIGLLETNADELQTTDAMTGYGVLRAGMIYENLLPEADGATPSVIPTGWKTELRARGGAWQFDQYSDNT